MCELAVRCPACGRVAALGEWLDDLDHAPPGIRTASPDWHATLRGFVDKYRMTPR